MLKYTLEDLAYALDSHRKHNISDDMLSKAGIDVEKIKAMMKLSYDNTSDYFRTKMFETFKRFGVDFMDGILIAPDAWEIVYDDVFVSFGLK